MGRNKAAARARQAALARPVLAQPVAVAVAATAAAQPEPATGHAHTGRRAIRLSNLLPRTGFDWDFKRDGVGLVPDLRLHTIRRFEDAIRETYGYANRDIFEREVTAVLLRALEMGDDDITDTEPAVFWQKVRLSFAANDEESFATHRRMTPNTLIAFVAYALESREENKDNLQSVWGNLVKAIDTLGSRLMQEQNSEIWRVYYERPAEAHWAEEEDEGDDMTNSEDEHEIEEEIDDEEDTKVIKSQEFCVDEDMDGDVEMDEGTNVDDQDETMDDVDMLDEGVSNIMLLD